MSGDAVTLPEIGTSNWVSTSNRSLRSALSRGEHAGHDLASKAEKCLSSERSSGLATWQARRVIEHIERNIESRVKVAQLASLIGVSKGHFSRAFKQRVGLTPMSYVAVLRIERAKVMLTFSHDALTEIAIACGFGDQPHLTRWFRRMVGVTPGQYRRMTSLILRASLESHWRGGGCHDEAADCLRCERDAS